MRKYLRNLAAVAVTVKNMRLPDKVLFCLENYPQTRNCDISLTIKIWEVYHQDKINNGSVSLSDLYDLPREDNVKRYRAKIQNVEKLFLPTDPEVIKKRNIKEDEWREELGYASQATGEPQTGDKRPSGISTQEGLFQMNTERLKASDPYSY